MTTESQAIAAFAALAQEARLRIIRLLVEAGPSGLPAGAIAKAVGVSPSNLSFHIAQLERAGLVASSRHQRSIHYTCAYPALDGLLKFLMENCCSGALRVTTAAGRTGAQPRRTTLSKLSRKA